MRKSIRQFSRLLITMHSIGQTIKVAPFLETCI